MASEFSNADWMRLAALTDERDAARAEAARYREALEEIATGRTIYGLTEYPGCGHDRIARAALAHQDGSDEK